MKKFKINFYSIFSLLTIISLLQSCATPVLRDTTRNIRREIKTGNYQKALNVILSEPTYKEKKTSLLLHMEQGLLYHLMGKTEDSLRHLSEAKNIHQKLYTISIKKKIQTLVTNETFDSYYGSLFERSLIHFYLTLGHFKLYQKSQKRNHLLNARAEVVSWDSFLDTQQKTRRGRSVFKNDLLAKTFGAYIHETIGTKKELGIALQLYKDAKILLFRNYNSYKTYNKLSKKFKMDFKKLPQLGEKRVKKDYVQETTFSSQLIQFLDKKIVSLTLNLRPYELKRITKKFNISQSIVKEAKSVSKLPNVGFVIQNGLIPPKFASKQHYSLEKALTPDNPTKTQREVAKVGSFVLLAFAANQLGLFPPSNRYDPVGAEIGIRLTDYSTSGLAISFELPAVKSKPITEKLFLEVFDLKTNELVFKNPLPIVSPLGDIAEEAVAEYSAAIYPKLGARLAMKHFAAILSSYLTYKAMMRDKSQRYWAKITALTQYLALTKAIEASEKADTRYWSSLPATIHLADGYLKKGNYRAQVVIRATDNKSAPSRVYPLGKFNIEKENQKKVLNFRLK